jgi:hypothetical protein
VGEVALEAVDVLEALVPHVLRDELRRQPLRAQQVLVDAHDQDLLVPRAVEDADPPALRQVPRVAPEEVVVELLGRRRFEGRDLAARRVHAREDVLDRRVLARGVHRLEEQEHRPAVLRVELSLQLGEALDARREHLVAAVGRRETRRVRGVRVTEAESLRTVHAETRGEPCDGLDDPSGDSIGHDAAFPQPRHVRA